jgi:hypothetical protein
VGLLLAVLSALPGTGRRLPSALAAGHREIEATRLDNRPRKRRLDSVCMACMNISDAGSCLATATESPCQSTHFALS